MQANVINTQQDDNAFAWVYGGYDVPGAPAPGSAANAARSLLDLKRIGVHILIALTLTVTLLAQPLAASLYAVVHKAASDPASFAAPVAQVLPSTGAPNKSQYFAPTGKTVSGDFLNFFQKYGLARIGYPVSDERNENGQRVQYFERVRMESHPELNKPGNNVLLTRLGVQISQGSNFATVAPFTSTSTRAYIKETRHSLAEPFLSYWKNNGGIELFGFPISEAITQDGMTVQWFERARMEHHPELASKGQAVQLTLLGKLAYERANPAPAAQAPSGGGGVAAPQAPQAPQGGASSQVKLNEHESYLLKAINEQRAAAGLSPVQINSALTDLSRYRSSDMASRNYFSHVTPEGAKFLGMLSDRGISYKFAGEILARNNYPSDETARVAMESYLGSAPHKAILLDARFTQVGVGYGLGAEEMSYFTVIFVQP